MILTRNILPVEGASDFVTNMTNSVVWTDQEQEKSYFDYVLGEYDEVQTLQDFLYKTLQNLLETSSEDDNIPKLYQQAIDALENPSPIFQQTQDTYVPGSFNIIISPPPGFVMLFTWKGWPRVNGPEVTHVRKELRSRKSRNA